MLITELKNAIVVDLKFAKPNVMSTIVKVDSDGFYYSIGQNGNSKKVTYDVFNQCYLQLQTNGSFTREWFNEKFPVIANTASCSFTTIGGLFQHFGLANYQKSTYLSTKEV